MIASLAMVWISAMAVAALGHVLARWRRSAGVATLAALAAALVWHAAALASFPAILLLLVPGSSVLVASLALGYALAVGATLLPVVRRTTA